MTFEEAERFWHYGDMTDEEIAKHKKEVTRHMKDIEEMLK